MSADRELLELAAKAAGLPYTKDNYSSPGELTHLDKPWGMVESMTTMWNPLIDDGDALRLVVKLEIDLTFSRKHVDAIADKRVLRGEAKSFLNLALFEEWSKDRCSATRRAIVRAAAEIGRAMP